MMEGLFFSIVPFLALASAAPANRHMPAAPRSISNVQTSQPIATAGASQYSSARSMHSSRISSASQDASGDSFSYHSDSAVPYSAVPTLSAYPQVISDTYGQTTHGPYHGSPTTTGALQSGPAAASMVPIPHATASYYNPTGELTSEEPIPYTPAGGVGNSGQLPRYLVESDFDFESIALGLYQEYIEEDLFRNGLAVFSDQDFIDAGLTAEDRHYIEFMADQEVGHATLLSNMLGEAAPVQCTYDYPFKTVREFVDFNQRLTRWGESGVWGFLAHLDSREVAQLLSQSIATEARQEMSFRQMSGLHPMSVWFETGIPQSWAWTYLAPYISSCPENTTRLAWQNFPTLHIVNNANINRWSPNDTKAYEVTGRHDESCLHVGKTGYDCSPAITHDRYEPLSFPGKKVVFEWETPGKPIGPNMSYATSTAAGEPQFAAFVNQYNATYVPLHKTGQNKGFAYQPDSSVFKNEPQVNQTMFVALTDEDLYVTPFNFSMINPHVVALGLYMAG